MSSDSEERCAPEIRAISEANNHLAFSLYRLLAKEDKNVFFSPFSLSAAMAMLFCGATGETAQELRQALGYDVAKLKDEELQTSFQRVLEELEKNPEAYTLAVANSMVSHKEFAIKATYKALLKDSFRAHLQEADLTGDPAMAVQQINAWVGQKTNMMVPRLLESLDPSTVLVLLNAVYFKGFWVRAFDPKHTFLQYFYNNGDDEDYRHVDMMHVKDYFRYAVRDGYRALVLPYRGEDIAMVVLLPDKRDGLPALEGTLSPGFFQDLKGCFYSSKVELALPKFRLEYSRSLVDQFRQLGVGRAFCFGADLGGIADSDRLCVSDVFHKAVVEVNEEGCEASAATAVGVVAYSLLRVEDPEFIVDHPFAFCIYNTKSDLVLFVGKVNELG